MELYSSIKNRFLSQFMDAAQYENTEIVTSVQGDNYERLFVTKGRILINKGWLKLYNEDKKEELLPKISENEKVESSDTVVVSKKSKPPAHYTEKTLLKSMETCGKGNKSQEQDDEESQILYGYSIGTAATRADTINKLKYARYISTKGKSLLITDIGSKLIENFPVKELMDTDYTGRLEKKLYDIEKGSYNKDEFLKEIYNFTRVGVMRMKSSRATIINDTREAKEIKK